MKKQVMKTATILSMIIATASFVGCGGENHHNEGENHEMHGDTTATMMDASHTSYACPMHANITGSKGDTCSECGMDLEEVKE